MFGIGPIPDELKSLPRLSPSSLAFFLESPAHYKAYKDKQFETTKAMEEGTLIHMACLEPEKFMELHCCEPLKEQFPNALVTVQDIKEALDGLNIPYKKSANKPELIALVKLHAPHLQIFEDLYEAITDGKIALSNKIWNACLNLSAKISKREFESKIWPSAVKEEYMWWQHKSGVIISMKPDLYAMDLGENKNINVVLDIKKVGSVDNRSLGYEMADNYNHMKAALYADGLSIIKKREFNYFCFLFVTATAPYSVKNVSLNFGQIEAGRELYNAAIDAWLECYQNNYWPDEAEEVINWTEPNYFFKNVEDQTNILSVFTDQVRNKFKGVAR